MFLFLFRFRFLPLWAYRLVVCTSARVPGECPDPYAPFEFETADVVVSNAPFTRSFAVCVVTTHSIAVPGSLHASESAAVDFENAGVSDDIRVPVRLFSFSCRFVVVFSRYGSRPVSVCYRVWGKRGAIGDSLCPFRSFFLFLFVFS